MQNKISTINAGIDEIKRSRKNPFMGFPTRCQASQFIPGWLGISGGGILQDMLQESLPAGFIIR